MLLTLVALAATPAAPTPDTTLRIPRGTALSVESMLAPVRLEGGPGDRVTVRNGTARLRGGRLEVEASGSGTLEVTVPAWAGTFVGSLSGQVDVSNAPAELEIDGMAGAVTVTGGTGRLVISAGAGSVAVSGYEGVVEIEAIAGTVAIRDAAGSFHVETVNAGIRLERVRSASVSASSTNGSIEWLGAIPTDARYTLESHGGDIHLTVTPDLDARVRVRTFMGSFDTAIPARTSGARERSVAPWEGEHELVATYGEGTATIEVTTFNGSVRIRPLGGT